MTFNADGKVEVMAGDNVKIVYGNVNTFLQKKTINKGDILHTMTVKNRTNGKSADFDFILEPIYEGDVVFRLNITNVPQSADLTALYK